MNDAALIRERDRIVSLYGRQVADTTVMERLGVSAQTARRLRLIAEEQQPCEATLSERWGSASCERFGYYDPVAGGIRCWRHEVRGLRADDDLQADLAARIHECAS